MNNPQNNKSIAIIAATVIIIAVSLIAVNSNNQSITLSPTPLSVENQTSNSEMICADMSCNSPSDFNTDKPSTFEIIQKSIQNSMNNASKWFEDTKNDINRHIQHSNYDNYVAYSNR